MPLSCLSSLVLMETSYDTVTCAMKVLPQNLTLGHVKYGKISKQSLKRTTGQVLSSVQNPSLKIKIKCR